MSAFNVDQIVEKTKEEKLAAKKKAEENPQKKESKVPEVNYTI